MMNTKVRWMCAVVCALVVGCGGPEMDIASQTDGSDSLQTGTLALGVPTTVDEVLARATPGQPFHVNGDMMLGAKTTLNGVDIRVSGSIRAPAGAELEGLNGASLTARGSISMGRLIGGPGGIKVSAMGDFNRSGGMGVMNDLNFSGDVIGNVYLNCSGNVNVGGMFVGGQKVDGYTIIGGAGGATVYATTLHVYGGDFVGRNYLYKAQVTPPNTAGARIYANVDTHGHDFIGRDKIVY
ncbi:hypothetical protein [Archangium sp.]|uniref:hypothetical protein n=1 Tax=Archangium sp. TaxID=1872627 RepID=UPI002D40CB5D|nr:hypothetical protein [Archangium sp.]HYO54891.1 hypothetical protein [Archangium sp.]